MKKLIIAAPLLIGIILVVVFGAFSAMNFFSPGEELMLTSSTLTDAIDISELSSAQFTYNGIAELYEDNTNEDILCYIRYNSKIKCGIDMKDVSFAIDHNGKTVSAVLPDVKINVNTVDEKSFSFIPENIKLELATAITACKEDALSEAAKSTELKEAAEENLKSIIEALLYPILDAEGYTIVWA